MRIQVAVILTLWSFYAHQATEAIIVRAEDVSITTSKPMLMLVKKSNKTHDDIISDTRIRRLIPYMSYYHHVANDYFPQEYLQTQQNVMQRKKPVSQIPNIAFLYGGIKSSPPHRPPAVQAGFIYKAREPYKTYSQVQPQMQPSYHSYKYQPLNSAYQPSAEHKPVVTSDKNSFTPFVEANKLPGYFMPIFKSKNLPYKSHAYEIAAADISSEAHYEHKIEKMNPLDDDEFLPMFPSQPAQFYKSPSHNHLFHSKVVSPTRHQSLNKPLKHSTPTLYITTTETPQALPEYTKHSPSPSYDYQEIIIDHTSPTPEYHTVKVTTFAPDEKYLHSIKDSQIKPVTEPNQEGSASGERGSISGILTNLQKNNHSPDILTPDIKTLEKILVEINQNEVVAKPPLPVRHNYANYDDDYEDDDHLRDGSPGPNSGRPGIDYPNYHTIPETSFSCKDQRYKGFFGDPGSSCQVWHYCDLNGGKASFLCPNGTIFSQIALTCDWWFNVKCSSTPQLYVLNERLYKYILPFVPKFPEDYSGPLVDKYLAIKFQEMEEKLKREKEKEKEEAAAEAVKSTAEENNRNEVEEVESEAVHKLTAVQSFSKDDDSDSYTPGPIQVPTYDSTENNSILVSDLPPSSSLPPVPQTIVEHERLEMIEIKNVGTSGHLTHSLE